jgi:hypothetical protein
VNADAMLRRASTPGVGGTDQLAWGEALFGT